MSRHNQTNATRLSSEEKSKARTTPQQAYDIGFDKPYRRTAPLFLLKFDVSDEVRTAYKNGQRDGRRARRQKVRCVK